LIRSGGVYLAGCLCPVDGAIGVLLEEVGRVVGREVEHPYHFVINVIVDICDGENHILLVSFGVVVTD